MEGWTTTEEHTVVSTDDAPDTPAPLFAFNAFKHAIFGTPKIEENLRKPRRRDLRSTNSGSNATRRKAAWTPTIASPAKGILATPRTAGAARKSVSFGRAPYQPQLETESRGVAIHEGTREQPFAPLSKRIGIPGQGTDSMATDQQKSLVPSFDGHDALSQRFERLSTKPQVSEIASAHVQSRQPESFWEERYNTYAARSEQEMRVILEREQLAKRFARHRDEDALKLEEELLQERRKVKELEAKLQNLTASGMRRSHDEALQRQLETLRMENKKLKADLEDVTQSYRDHSRPTNVPRHGRTPPRSSADLTPATARPPSVRASKDVMSSDIWVGAGFEAAADVIPQRSGSRHVRKPLKEAAGNGPSARLHGTVVSDRGNENDVSLDKVFQASTIPAMTSRPAQSSIGGMTAERKQAALRRLEERRRNRAANVG